MCYFSSSCVCFTLPTASHSAPFLFFIIHWIFFPVLPPSEPSSCSPSPALSIESLSSTSDHSSSQLLKSAGASSDQLPVFTKSISEPSICSPCEPTSSSSSSECLPHASQSLYPAPTPSNATSAPATPQTSRSSGTGATPSPLASGGTQSHNKVSLPRIKQHKAFQTEEITLTDLLSL